MGTKVNPTGFRLGQTRNWDSSWRTNNKLEFSKKFHLELQIKELISTTLSYRGILMGKIFVREVTSKSNLLVIKGTYYITPNFISGTKKGEVSSNFNTLDKNIHGFVQNEVKRNLSRFISKYGLNYDIELDLTNILNLGYNHSLDVMKTSEQKLKGPLMKAGYVKDLYNLS